MTVSVHSLTDNEKSTGHANQARDGKKTKLTQLLDMQDVTYRDVMDPTVSPGERAQAIRAWDVLEDRIRILRGRVKPGSRNVSVREVADGAPGRRLPAPRARNRHADFLAAAAADLARAQAASAPAEPTE